MDKTELILKTLVDTGKALKAGEIAELSGIDKKEVDKALKKLKDEEKIEVPKRCFYQAKK